MWRTESLSNPFKFDLPAGWEDQTVYNFIGPEACGIRHSLRLMIDRHLQLEAVQDYARQQTAPIVESLQGVEVLKDEEVTIENGNPCWEFVYKWTPSDERTTFQKHVFVVKDGMGFNFAASFTKNTIKTVGSQLYDIVDSLLPGTYYPIDD